MSRRIYGVRSHSGDPGETGDPNALVFTSEDALDYIWHKLRMFQSRPPV